MNVCLITSLKFVVRWQDPLKVLGAMLFSPHHVWDIEGTLQIGGETQDSREMMFFVAADLSVNFQYGHQRPIFTKQAPNDTLRDPEYTW